MTIDVDVLLETMLKAARGSLQKQWPKARDYATSEFRKLLWAARHIQDLKTQGKITEEEARFLMGLHKNAARSVLLSVEGLGILAVEDALNAALNAVRDVLNAALGTGWKFF